MRHCSLCASILENVLVSTHLWSFFSERLHLGSGRKCGSFVFFVVKFPFFDKNRAWMPWVGSSDFRRTDWWSRVWENRGRTVGGSKEPWENRGDFTKNRGRTVGTLQRTVGEPWGLYKEPLENRGDFTKNRGRTVGIQVLKSNDLVVAKSENRGRTVGIFRRTVGEPWGFSGEPWENRGDFPENRGRTVGIFRRTVGEPWGEI